jgi:hypothetical protein
VRRPTLIHLARLVPFAVAGILISACGSTAAATGGGGGGSQAASGSSASGNSGSTTSVNDGIGDAINVCSLIPAATAASASGEPITVATEDDTLSYKIYSCDYTSADGTMGFDIDVLALDAVAGYTADVQDHQTAGSPVTPISGLGDKAFSTSDGVEALFGNVSIHVANLSGQTQGCETLIRDLQAKL